MQAEPEPEPETEAAEPLKPRYRRVTIQLPETLYRELADTAEEEGRSLSALIRRALGRMLEERPAQPPR